MAINVISQKNEKGKGKEKGRKGRKKQKKKKLNYCLIALLAPWIFSEEGEKMGGNSEKIRRKN